MCEGLIGGIVRLTVIGQQHAEMKTSVSAMNFLSRRSHSRVKLSQVSEFRLVDPTEVLDLSSAQFE